MQKLRKRKPKLSDRIDLATAGMINNTRLIRDMVVVCQILVNKGVVTHEEIKQERQRITDKVTEDNTKDSIQSKDTRSNVNSGGPKGLRIFREVSDSRTTTDNGDKKQESSGRDTDQGESSIIAGDL